MRIFTTIRLTIECAMQSARLNVSSGPAQPASRLGQALPFSSYAEAGCQSSSREAKVMDKCSECGERCSQDRIVLEFAGETCTFCSFECLITHAAATLRRQIARRNRKVRRYVQAKMRCQNVRARASAKVGVRL